MTQSADNIYFNITIANDANNGDGLTLAVYDETLTIPLLNNPQDYYCSIIRFQIPLNSIPFFYFPLDISQTDPNRSNCIIGIRDAAGNYFPRPVFFEPYGGSPPRAVGPFTQNDSTNIYYQIFSVSYWLDCINRALVQCATDAGIMIPPFYTLNTTNGTISLTAPNLFLFPNPAYPTPAPPYSPPAGIPLIYMNANLNNFLSSFKTALVQFNDNIPVTTPAPIMTVPRSFEFFHILTLPPGSTSSSTIFQEDFQSLSLWSDLQRLVITSTSLPINYEITPLVATGSNQSGVATYVPIITDFALSIDDVAQSLSIAIYSPTTQYRLVDMTSNAPISKINLQVFWADKYGNLIPLSITSGQQITIKLAFLKKDLYKNSNLLK